MLQKVLIFTTALIVSVYSQQLIDETKPELKSSLTLLEVSQFIEGWIAGVIKQDLNNLETCLIDIEEISQGIITSVRDFEELSFSGMKRGLTEISETVKKIPKSIKDCTSVASIDFTNVFSMITIFQHPLQLVYKAGKNLWMNGRDIYQNIVDALVAFKNGDYKMFGKHIGQAMEDIFTNAPYSEPDQKYKMFSEFYKGFFETHQSISDIDSMKYYEAFNNLGIMFTGPSGEAINNLRISDGKYQDKLREALSKASQALIDSSDQIIDQNVITQDQKSQIVRYAKCMSMTKPMESEEFLTRAITDVIKDYGDKYIEGLGVFVGNIAKEYCIPRKRQFLKKQKYQEEIQ